MTVTAPMLVALCAVAAPFVLVSPFVAEKVARWRRTRRRTASMFARPLTPGDGGTPGPAPVRLAGSGVDLSAVGPRPSARPAGPTAGFSVVPAHQLGGQEGAAYATLAGRRGSDPEPPAAAAGPQAAAAARHTPGGAS